MTEDEINFTNNHKPTRILPPIISDNIADDWVDVIYNKNKTIDFIKKMISDYVGADCWGLYLTNNSKVTTKIYFDTRNDNSNEVIRDTIINNSSDLIEFAKTNNYIIHIILGKYCFVDCHIYYDKETESFDMIEIKYQKYDYCLKLEDIFLTSY